MVLSGTLREFILADVFQLLSQQKITGKLVLSNGGTEGSVIFRDGLIVSAENDEEKFQRKLFNYLVDFRGQQVPRLRDLFAGREGDIDGLTAEVIRRNLMTAEEIAAFAEGLIEDIACGLFLWTKGTYRFSSFKNVDSMIPAGVAIATENIVMEAMRRVDEWNRMQEYIIDDLVFVKTDRNDGTSGSFADTKLHPEEYVLTRIDGTTTVQSLVHNSCLSEFKVYEAVNLLLQANRIVPLSEKLTRSVKAALERKEFEQTSAPLSIAISVATAAGMVLVVLFLGWFLFRNVLFSDKQDMATTRRTELRLAQAEQKARVAQAYFTALYGAKPARLGDLRRESLLATADLKPFAELKSRLEQSGGELYTEKHTR